VNAQEVETCTAREQLEVAADRVRDYRKSRKRQSRSRRPMPRSRNRDGLQLLLDKKKKKREIVQKPRRKTGPRTSGEGVIVAGEAEQKLLATEGPQKKVLERGSAKKEDT